MRIYGFIIEKVKLFMKQKKDVRNEMDSHHVIKSFSFKNQDFKLKNLEWEILFPFDKSSEYIENQ